MASLEPTARSSSPADDEPSFPQISRSENAGPPSIISSRMTDIGSDDEGEREQESQQPKDASSPKKSALASETLSRPSTAKTALSSKRGPTRRANSGGACHRRG